MKKYSFIVLLFFCVSGLVAQDVIASVAARQIARLLLNPGPHGIAPFQHWSTHKPYFIGCRVGNHFGLVNRYYPARCVYLNDDDKQVQAQKFAPLFADDQSIELAARHFTESGKGQHYKWKHQSHDWSHYESLCLTPKRSDSSLCLVASDAFTRWEVTAFFLGAIVMSVIIICPVINHYL